MSASEAQRLLAMVTATLEPAALSLQVATRSTVELQVVACWEPALRYVLQLHSL